MHLNEFDKKHWYYRLKREYKAEAKVLKRLEERKAKKDFRKMLKKLNIEKTLEEQQNFDKFYTEPAKDDSKNEEKKLPPGFASLEEHKFYNGDVDFMRFHKRTKLNMHREL